MNKNKIYSWSRHGLKRYLSLSRRLHFPITCYFCLSAWRKPAHYSTLRYSCSSIVILIAIVIRAPITTCVHTLNFFNKIHLDCGSRELMRLTINSLVSSQIWICLVCLNSCTQFTTNQNFSSYQMHRSSRHLNDS